MVLKLLCLWVHQIHQKYVVQNHLSHIVLCKTTFFTFDYHIFIYFSECLYKLPILKIHLFNHTKWFSSSSLLSVALDSHSSSSSGSNSSMFSYTSLESQTSSKVHNNDRDRLMPIPISATFSFLQLLKSMSYNETQKDLSNKSTDKSVHKSSENFRILDIFARSEKDNWYYNNGKDNNSHKIDIYLRIKNIMMTADKGKVLYWVWVNSPPTIGNHFCPYINDTVLKIRMLSESNEKGKRFAKDQSFDWKIKKLRNRAFLRYYINESLNDSKHEFKQRSNFFRASKMIPDFETEEKQMYSDHAYLKIATISGNISSLNMKSLDNLLYIEAGFFQNNLFNIPGVEEIVVSHCKSKKYFKCMQEIIEIVYVLNDDHKITTKRSLNDTKVAKQMSTTTSAYKMSEHHKRHRRSNNRIVSSDAAIFPTTFTNNNDIEKERSNSTVINYTYKSQLPTSQPPLSRPLFKISNNNNNGLRSVARSNKKSALPHVHLSNGPDLKENDEVFVSNSLTPSSILIPRRENSKLKYKTFSNKTKNYSSYLKSKSKINLKSGYNKQLLTEDTNFYSSSKNLNDATHRSSPQKRSICENWFHISSDSPIITITDVSVHLQEDTLAKEIFGEQKSAKSTNESNGSSDKFDKSNLGTNTQHSLSSFVHCAAQIRLPYGYWPRIKVTVIQGKLHTLFYLRIS